MSALLTTTMQNTKVTIDEIGEAGLRDTTKIILGGAPVTEDYAKQCGADGYASNAAAAVDMARALTA